VIREAWLVFKLHRFEVVAVAAASVLLALGAIVVAGMLSDASVPFRCFLLVPEEEAIPAECATTERFGELNNGYAAYTMAAMAVLPFVGGVLLGVPLVGQEVERRTAQLAWSMSGSRRRWLLVRLVAAGVLLAALLSLPAFATGLLEAARVPDIDPSVSFEDYGLRGPVVVARGVLALAVGVLAGAVVGRVLPALIVASVACIVVFNLLMIAMPFGQPVEKIPSPISNQRGNLYLFTEGSQSVLTNDPEPVNGVLGTHLREVEAREIAVVVLGFVLLAAVSLAVVDRRRPY
jgi:ABC-type transport system involved in multi-copper enzyme maturation permease subunit